jgi:hypothetical protein
VLEDARPMTAICRVSGRTGITVSDPADEVTMLLDDTG